MIKRNLYLDQIRPFFNSELIKVIVGIRRAGKSTLMKQIMNELRDKNNVQPTQILYLNFEDYAIRELKSAEKLHDYVLANLYSSGKTYIFLDEIQEVNGFEQVVSSINATQNVDFYLTGSNSKMLSGEYATLLSGRYKSFMVFPFSFKEMKEIHPQKSNRELFNEYLVFGGFPVLHQFEGDNEKKSILRDLFDSIVIKDIVSRYNINGVDALDKFLSYILNTISSQFNAVNILNYFISEGRSISKETLYNYTKYAKEVLLIYPARRYDVKGKRRLTTNEKYFVNDQGLRSTKFDNIKDIEKILENIVFFELLRRGFNVTVGNINDKEIDFIAERNNKIEYYQVAYIMENPETRDREFGSLNLIRDQYPKFVLSLDNVDFSQLGIVHKNIIQFLLEE